MNILITGGAGFIGSNLIRKINLLYPDYNIVVFDSFGEFGSLGSFQNLLGLNCEVIAGNLSSPEDLKMLLYSKHFEVVFHLGAISDTTVLDQNLVFRTNINSFYTLLDYCVENKTRLIYASSAAVYGNSSSPNQIGKESPLNPYAFSKLQMDIIAKKFFYSKIPSLIGLRFFNVYGYGESYKGKTASTIYQFAQQALHHQEIRIFENSENYFRDLT